MFAHIKGILVYSTATYAVVDANGVGYKIFVPTSASSKFPQEGQPLILYTALVVRELVQSLYGFITLQERDFFEALLNVTGIGPKIALAVISHMSVREFQQAILNEDIAVFCRVPGIGKKGAERLIIEMRDKAPALEAAPQDFAVSLPVNAKKQVIHDAMSALINLGYTQNIAQKALKKTLQDSDEDPDLSTLIAKSLKHVY